VEYLVALDRPRQRLGRRQQGGQARSLVGEGRDVGRDADGAGQRAVAGVDRGVGHVEHRPADRHLAPGHVPSECLLGKGEDSGPGREYLAGGVANHHRVRAPQRRHTAPLQQGDRARGVQRAQDDGRVGDDRAQTLLARP